MRAKGDFSFVKLEEFLLSSSYSSSSSPSSSVCGAGGTPPIALQP
jgi:hypothetical protein